MLLYTSVRTHEKSQGCHRWKYSFKPLVGAHALVLSPPLVGTTLSTFVRGHIYQRLKGGFILLLSVPVESRKFHRWEGGFNCLSVHARVASSCGRNEERLLDTIFNVRKYNPYARPVEKDTEALEVSFGIALQQIIDVVTIVARVQVYHVTILVCIRIDFSNRGYRHLDGHHLGGRHVDGHHLGGRHLGGCQDGT